jgi:Xaa-Pro aminopeptidase
LSAVRLRPRDEELAFPRFSDAEHARRFESVRARMREHDLAVILVFADSRNQADVQYLTGFQARWESYMVLSLVDQPSLHVELFNHVPNAREYAVIEDVRWAGASTTDGVFERLTELGLSTAAIGLVGAVPFQHYLKLQAAFPSARLSDFTPAFRRLRWIKSAEEIEWARRGAHLCDVAVQALAEQARPGMKEYELGAIVQSAYLREGGQHVISFIGTTSMHGPRRPLPAQVYSERVLKRGDVIMTEISAHYWGYSGQVLRTFSVGEPPTPLYQRLYDITAETYRRVAAAIRPGVTAREVLEVTVFVEESGFTIVDDLVHGFVGGYLPPILRTPQTQHGEVPDLVFEPGMMVVIQPNVTTRDETAGVQEGDLHLVTETGTESLHSFPLGFGRCG